MEIHFICPSCKEESQEPINCNNEDCSKVNHPLKECTCLDGNHEDLEII